MSANSLGAQIREPILGYHRSTAESAFKRIEDYLNRKQLVLVTRKQIKNVLKESGLLELLDSSFGEALLDILKGCKLACNPKGSLLDLGRHGSVLNKWKSNMSAGPRKRNSFAAAVSVVSGNLGTCSAM